MMDEPVVNVAVIYYSATGTVFALAKAAASAAEKAGVQVRLRKVRELAPDEAIASNEGWAAHAAATQHIVEASLEDLKWADAFLFGTPNAQMKQFLKRSPRMNPGIPASLGLRLCAGLRCCCLAVGLPAPGRLELPGGSSPQPADPVRAARTPPSRR